MGFQLDLAEISRITWGKPEDDNISRDAKTMPPEIDPTIPTTETKQYSDEEITKILNTAQATRKERDEAAKRAKDLETQVAQLSENLEKIKGIDPAKYKELENIAASYEERKLEEQQKFSEVKELWGSEKTSLQQQIQQLQEKSKQQTIVNALEKSFYATGGKSGRDDDGLTYFDLIKSRAASYIVLDESDKITIIDPKDKTILRDAKGVPFTVDDLMFKLRSGGPTASLFEPISNGAGGGMNRGQGSQNTGMVREQIMQIGSRSDRLAKARALGIP